MSIHSLMPAFAVLLLAVCCGARAHGSGPDTPTRPPITLLIASTSVTGGLSVDLTVSVDDPVGSNTTVSLSSSPSSAFTNLPSSVVIPSGYSSVVVTVTTATVSTTVNATVTASATNYTTGTCGVTITP